MKIKFHWIKNIPNSSTPTWHKHFIKCFKTIIGKLSFVNSYYENFEEIILRGRSQMKCFKQLNLQLFLLLDNQKTLKKRMSLVIPYCTQKSILDNLYLPTPLLTPLANASLVTSISSTGHHNKMTRHPCFNFLVTTF